MIQDCSHFTRKGVDTGVSLGVPRVFPKCYGSGKSIFISDVPSIIHWHKIPSNYDTDEGIHYRLSSELYDNCKLMRSQEEPISNEGMGLRLSGFFYRACAIFLYVALRYHPHQINIRILWKLCEQVDPNVKNLDYLIQKLPFDFIEFLNPSKNLHRNFYFLNQQHLNILDEPAQGFLDLGDKQFDNTKNQRNCVGFCSLAVTDCQSATSGLLSKIFIFSPSSINLKKRVVLQRTLPKFLKMKTF